LPRVRFDACEHEPESRGATWGDRRRQTPKHFDDFARQRGLRAKAGVLVQRIAHTERARLALEAGGGLGVVKYNGLWAVVVRVPASVTGAVVVGVPFAEGEFEGRWQHIDVVFDDAAEAVHEVDVQGVMVDHGQLLFSGPA
jgi:hypothetical protein